MVQQRHPVSLADHEMGQFHSEKAWDMTYLVTHDISHLDSVAVVLVLRLSLQDHMLADVCNASVVADSDNFALHDACSITLDDMTPG